TMRLLLLLALASVASANIFEDAYHGVKQFLGFEDEPEQPVIDNGAIESPKDDPAAVEPAKREKRSCGCGSPNCPHSVDKKYLPLFHKLHRGQCGCKHTKPCGCPKPCGCHNHPHHPCPHGHNHGGYPHQHDGHPHYPYYDDNNNHGYPHHY
ncbi:hypothetical protein PFISCL1PPCAC_28180, partial [Pristionchus fissidentatus]